MPALEGVAELTWGAGLGRVADRLTCRLQREDLAVVGDVAERDVADGERPEPGGELRVLLVVEELLAEEHCLVDEQRVAHRLDLPVGERLAQVEPGDLGAARDRLRLHCDDSVGDGGRETLLHLRERARLEDLEVPRCRGRHSRGVLAVVAGYNTGPAFRSRQDGWLITGGPCRS